MHEPNAARLFEHDDVFSTSDDDNHNACAAEQRALRRDGHDADEPVGTN